MKKLIFSAVVAIFAIGSAATSANADTFFSAGGTTTFNCNEGNLSCATAIGDRTVYRINDPEVENQGPAVNPLDYEDLLFQPN